MGPKTNAEKRTTDELAAAYQPLSVKVMNAIKYRIENNPILNDLKNQGHIPDILVTTKTLGGSVPRGTTVRALRRRFSQIHKQGNTINTEEIEKTVRQELNNIISEVLNENPAFKMKYAAGPRLDIMDIILDEDKTGLKRFNKGDALHAIVKDYELSSIVIFGDDIADVAMKKTAQLLVATNKHKQLDSMQADNKSDPNRFISKIETKHDIILTDEQKQKIAQTNFDLHQALLSLNKGRLSHSLTTLQSYAFVGVKYPPKVGPNAQEVLDAANIMVDQPSGALDLVYGIARKIKEIREREITHDCWQGLKDCQSDINQHLENFKSTPDAECMAKLKGALEKLDIAAENSHMRVREISADFEEPLLEIHQSIRQFEKNLSDAGTELSDDQHTIQSFQDKISKHMLSFTKAIAPLHLGKATFSMPIKYVKRQWGDDYAKAVVLLRGERAAKMTSSTNFEDVASTNFETPTTNAVNSEDLLESSTKVGQDTYSSKLDPKKGTIRCERNSSGKTEQEWQIWGHQIEALASEAREIDSTLPKLNIASDIFEIDPERLQQDPEWEQVVRRMEQEVIKDYPHLSQLKLTEVTIPIDDDAKHTLELFAPHVFVSETHEKGSDLHTAVLGTQSGKDISTLLRHVLPGRQVTKITTTSDKITFSLGPDEEFKQKMWEKIELQDMENGDAYKYQLIREGGIDKIDPNWLRETQKQLSETPQWLATAEQEFSKAQEQFSKAQEQFSKAQEQFGIYRKVSDYLSKRRDAE
jgi:hypothetical protein